MMDYCALWTADSALALLDDFFAVMSRHSMVPVTLICYRRIRVRTPVVGETGESAESALRVSCGEPCPMRREPYTVSVSHITSSL